MKSPLNIVKRVSCRGIPLDRMTKSLPSKIYMMSLLPLLALSFLTAWVGVGVSGRNNPTRPTTMYAKTLTSGVNPTSNGSAIAFPITALADSDGDGIDDSIDLDDDNDGILDCNENLLNSSIDQYMTTNGNALKVAANEIQLTSATNSQSGYVVAKGKIDFTKSFSLSFEAYLGNNDAGADGINAIFFDNFTSLKGVVLELDTWYNSTLGDIVADHTHIWDLKKGSATGGLTTPIAFSNLENGAWHPVVISWNASTQTLSYTVDGIAAGTYTGDLVNTVFGGESMMSFDFLGTTGSANNDQRIRITDGCSLPFQLDTDSDGIINQYDLDSDGDGCPDAIEGGAVLTVASLAANGSLSGSVDANGVPTIAGATGQVIGTSQNATQQDVNCSVIASNDVATTTGTAITIPVLTNDIDGGVPATLANVSLPTITSPPLATQGTATVNPDGTITFTPAPGYFGSAPFTYTICDKTNPILCSVGRVNVQATCSQFSILVSEFGIKPDGTSDGTLKTEVLSGNANGATMKCTIPGGGGEGITINPATNLAYIASPAGYVQVYNYATGTIVKNIDLTAQSGGILDISKSADGAYIYISTVTGGVLKFSTATDTVVATYPMTSLASGTTNLWGNAVNPITGNVYVSTGWWTQSGTNFKSIQYISPTLTGPATTFAIAPAGYYYRGIVFDANGDLWALLSGGGTLRDRIMKYNGTTGAVLGTYDIPTPASYLAGVNAQNGNFNPYDLDFGPDGNLYLSTYYGDCLTKFNVTTNTFSTYVPFVPGSGGKAFAFVCGDVQCPSGLLGGKVWVDANKDGQLNGTETVLANVTAQLYNATTNTLLANTTTDANGYYQFTTLPAGSYYVKFTTPSGYVYTLPNVGADATDSDANPSNGTTGNYTLAAGEANTTVYAGLVLQIVANPDAATTPLNTPVAIPVLPNDNNGGTAPTTSTVTTTITTPSPNGTATVNANGTITFTPNNGYVGTTTFTYTICDKVITTNCATTTVTVTVGCPTLAAPTLSATSRSNVCPLTTIDLSNLTASNAPSGFTLGWFSSTPASAANRLTSVTGLAAGTYYAAFYNATTGCYGPTTPVTATVVACCAVSNTVPSLIKN